MIDIIILTEEFNTEMTLSSLVNNSENFRIHLFNRRGILAENMEPTINWAMKNFREVYSYQTPFAFRGTGSNRMARVLLQFKEHWKDKAPKGAPIERVIVHTKGPRIFNGKFEGNVPTVKAMGDNVLYFSRKYQYFDHPFYGNYYKILEMDAKKDDHEEDFLLLNWKLFKNKPNSYFFRGGKATREKNSLGEPLHDKDSFILSARDSEIFRHMKRMKHGYMPLYFDMRLDELIKKESIGPKDTMNHHTMMRKAFSVNIDQTYLFFDYYDMSTLCYMATPWDMWSNLIDDIPLNLRREGINERILQKADKQKRYLRKVVEAGYLLGKI
tara:strand:- start:442 stop:1422 length:981 start_codon:yes stop_codon:yes gene_type:complete